MGSFIGLLSLLMIMFDGGGYYSDIVPSQIKSIDLNLRDEDIAFSYLSLSDGEATLIQNADNESILVNTGASGTKEELKKLLSLYNIQKVSTIICTNIQNCNSENLDWLISNYDVKQLVIHSGIEGFIKDQLHGEEDTSLHIWSKGTSQKILPNLFAKVMNVEGDNGKGMDISFTYFSHRILDKSTYGKDSEVELMKQNLSDVNVVKLPQFGMRGSISNQLLKKMDPQVAILFFSKTKVPSPEILKMIHEAWIDMFYTKNHGNITIKFTKDNYEVITISNDEEFK